MARWEVTIEQFAQLPLRKPEAFEKTFTIYYARTQRQVEKAIRSAGIKGKILRVRKI